MKPGNKNSYNCLKSMQVDGKDYKYFSLKEAEKNGLAGISKLPKSLLVLLENLLRFEDGVSVTKSQIDDLTEKLYLAISNTIDQLQKEGLWSNQK